MPPLSLEDLPPKNDVKGGSPKTPPGGIPRSFIPEYQDAPTMMLPHTNGVWRALACGLAGLNVGLVVAWFTAIQTKGVSSKEMQEYVKDFSPYLSDKPAIAEHQRTQDEEIGKLIGKQERVIDQMSEIKAMQTNQDRDLNDCKKEMKLVADYMEEQRRLKK